MALKPKRSTATGKTRAPKTRSVKAPKARARSGGAGTKGIASRKLAAALAPDDHQTRSDELLIAAFDLFAQRNFASVTIKDIGAAIGVNTALIYYYFGNKEDLFRSAIEMAVDRAFKQFQVLRSERAASPDEVLDSWLENHVVLYELISKLVKISLDYAGSGRRLPSIDKSIRRFYDDEAIAVSQALREGAAKGIFRKVDALAFARFISTHLDGVMVRSVIFPDFKPRDAVDTLKQLVRSYLAPKK